MTKSPTLPYAQYQTREGMEWEISATDTNLAANLTGAVITLKIFNDDVVLVDDRDISSGIVAPATGGVVQYYPQTGDMDTIGEFTCELKIVFGDLSTGYILDKHIVIRPVTVGT